MGNFLSRFLPIGGGKIRNGSHMKKRTLCFLFTGKTTGPMHQNESVGPCLSPTGKTDSRDSINTKVFEEEGVGFGEGEEELSSESS